MAKKGEIIICPVCGKSFARKYRDKNNIIRCCSHECAVIKRKKSLNEKISLNKEEIVSKRRITCLERYGVENTSCLKTVQEKNKRTMQSDAFWPFLMLMHAENMPEITPVHKRLPELPSS